MQEQIQGTAGGELVSIMSGTAFLIMGLASSLLALARRRREMRVFVWLGAWSALYGILVLTESRFVFSAVPQWAQAGLPLLATAASYLILPVGSLTWLELSLGSLRKFLKAVIVLGLATGIVGIGYFVVTGVTGSLIVYKNALSAVALLVLLIVSAVPGYSRKFLVLPNRGVIIAGSLAFAMSALYFNVGSLLHYPVSLAVGSLGFAVLVLSFGYAAAQTAVAGERRLMSIENELAIAREIQASILPSGSPELKNLRIATAYRPMEAVAGDFYEFVAVDENRIGILVADVTGHGIPAALIAAMLKAATQFVAPQAHDPQEVMRGLNRIFTGQLRTQLVSAAYLWLDTEKGIGRYSAAGHPPLLRWREDKLERIEDNGVLLGVFEDSDYPLCELTVRAGDRFLLYTDGVSEPQNVGGHAFGDHKLEEVVRRNQSRPPMELLEELLLQIRNWQPASTPQQDDITLLAIDVLA